MSEDLRPPTPKLPSGSFKRVWTPPRDKRKGRKEELQARRASSALCGKSVNFKGSLVPDSACVCVCVRERELLYLE